MSWLYKSLYKQFYKILDNDKNKLDTKKILDIINGNDSICKMIRIYIYKILYNKHNIDVFINAESINKYKLKDLKILIYWLNLKNWLIYIKLIMKLIH